MQNLLVEIFYDVDTYVLRPYFPKLVSYNRFVELMQEALVPLLLYMTKFRNGKCTGISFIDSTTLDVCHNRRIHSHKVFKGIAESFKFAMNEVEKINAILKLYDISGNRFKIHLGPSARRKDLYKAITMFANEESVPANILEQLDECFDKMINSKDANTFSELADYRNYLDCDVMISHVDKKVWKSFSNEKGSFSGGQKETPYYMCLAAALSSKAYTTGGFRLIVLDEAFKNMDQINKVKALSMFQNLNLQTLLFTSNSDLVSYIDNIYVITKFEDRIVTAFGKNKESLSVVDKRIKVSA